MMKHAWALAALVMLGITTSVCSAAPVIITGDTANSESGLGDFEATLTFAALNATTATLTIQIENTTPVANGGFLTAFVLNNPNNAITGATLTRNAVNVTATQLLGSPSFNNNVSGQPWGSFDLGWGSGGDYEGGGPPSDGIGVGSIATFAFGLTGAGLNALTEQSFINTNSTGGGQGATFFLTRFRGFRGGGSDKVPGQIEVVPEPASLLVWSLIGLGAIPGAVLYRRRNAK